MSAHFIRRREVPHENAYQFSPHSARQPRSPFNHLTRPHTRSPIDPSSGTSAFAVIMLLLAILLGAGLVIFLIWSCLHSFQWFRNMMDPHARMRYSHEREERAGLWASRQGGAFVRGPERGAERQLLCDRSAYLGGGRGYGWRTRGYGDGAEGEEEGVWYADSTYGSLGGEGLQRRGSDSSGRSIRHRDDCTGDCGLTGRRGSREGNAGV